MHIATQQPAIDPQTLDRVTARYAVKTMSTIHIALEAVDVVCEFVIDCGLYSGVPNQEIISNLINSRGIHEFDIVETQSTKIPNLDIAEALNARGILPDDIIEMKISEIEIDDIIVAESL